MIIQTPRFEANVIVCEGIVPGRSGLLSAIHIINLLTLEPWVTVASFKVLTTINGYPGDPYQHVFQLNMITVDGSSVASTQPQNIVLTSPHPGSPGSFLVTSNFALGVSQLGNLGAYIIEARLDGILVGSAPITLRRATPQ